MANGTHSAVQANPCQIPTPKSAASNPNKVNAASNMGMLQIRLKLLAGMIKDVCG